MSKASYLNVPGWMTKNLSKSNAAIYSIVFNATSSKRGHFDGSINYLVEQTGDSRRTIIRHLKELEEMGAIKRVGYNSYKNVIYNSLLDETTIAKCQNNSKVSKCQSAKMTPLKCQNDTMQSAKMTPHKNIDLNKDNKDNISLYNNKKTLLYNSCVFAEKDGGFMIYSDLGIKTDFNNGNNQIGWWRGYSYFYDEESDKLFVQYLDRIAEDGNLTPKQVTTERMAIYNQVTTFTEIPDEVINNMTEDQLADLDRQDRQIDYIKLKNILDSETR